MSRRLLRRRAQRGNAVLVVVLAVLLLTGVGMFAVRNISQVDRAVGFARLSAQTGALADLGTTAAMSYVANLDSGMVKVAAKDPNLRCVANANPPAGVATTCYPFRGRDIEAQTTATGGKLLLEPTTSSDSGSLGVSANMQGLVDVELTDIQDSAGYKKGGDLKDKPVDATVTTRARMIPNQAGGNPCGAAVSSMTVKKVMRAHAIF